MSSTRFGIDACIREENNLLLLLLLLLLTVLPQYLVETDKSLITFVEYEEQYLTEGES